MHILPCTSREALALSLSQMYSVSKLLLTGKQYDSLGELTREAERGRCRIDSIGNKTLQKFRAAALVDIDHELKRMEKLGITPLIYGEEGYPVPLTEGVHDPPLVLYVRGDCSVLLDQAVAVVGTRTPSGGGRRLARRLGEDLARFPFVVVSGLASGVDAIAHEACLKAGGRTVAVLAHGLHTVHPRAHQQLADRIIERGGALVSEYPPGEPARKSTFVPRNRIIAALSIATVVVEGGVKSGARHTADFALEYERLVLAIPGNPIEPMAALPNRLIREKRAELCRGLEDVLASLPHYTIDGLRDAIDMRARMLTKKAGQALDLLGPDARQLMEQIGTDPLHVDDLCRLTALETSRILSLLLQMEIEGLVEQLPGMRYVANYRP
ncbi:DNA-processing protein DprA [Candidatus Zixiibacteriota bacterium]